jgi:alcohol dehydrogenase
VKAMVVTGYGSPLQAAELAQPALAPGHALLDVVACGVCFSDVKIARGKMPFSATLPLPHVPGHEICGRVVEVAPGDAGANGAGPGGAAGAGGARAPGEVVAAGARAAGGEAAAAATRATPPLAPGDLVVVHIVTPCGRCDRCRAGDEHICRDPVARAGFTHPGGFQERMVVPLDRLLPVPDGIDPAHAAPMTCALGTAYRAVVTRGGVTAGARVAVIGIGGVGIHALQVARAAGGLAVGLDRSAAAIDAAHDLGLDARDAGDPTVVPALLDESAGEGFDVVVDTVGRPATLQAAATLVRPGGRIVVVGYAVGQPIELDSARLVLEEVEVVGSRYARRSEMEQAIRLVADGRVKMVVDRVLDLKDADEAFAALEAGDVVGRLVVRIS